MITVSIICRAINLFRCKTLLTRPRTKASIMALSHLGLFALAPHQRANILFWVGVRQRWLHRGG